jgi:solute carrier family 25 protein 33/36
MTLEHASRPRSIRDDTSQTLQTLPPSSREIGEVIPPKLPDGAPVTTQGPSFAKSWAHFVAGG